MFYTLINCCIFSLLLLVTNYSPFFCFIYVLLLVFIKINLLVIFLNRNIYYTNSFMIKINFLFLENLQNKRKYRPKHKTAEQASKQSNKK